MPGRIQVLTVELTTEPIPLSGHLVVHGVNGTGTLGFHSLCISCSSAVDPTRKVSKDFYQATMNAVDLMRDRILEWIKADMALLEMTLVSLMQQGLNQIIRPTSQPEQCYLWKRSGSRS
jgi:hypothetical protein